ncbi:AfsR/SARP family transcriptional regulator [Nocardia blacklockiae]|uniref:AfsR/SARP family transcriptional regulator n=1 Tax=Nocardia blacklockiae TaxID=480036 RepID=UPI001892E931|nr:BTAD domain-containing putative transcriptional regulator [Nocardia blacklockiae]MBF6175693.1 winged helix-turn-helix domain-containing protein [Nocardia blacklockiae]
MTIANRTPRPAVVRFRLLGPVEAEADGIVRPLGAPRLRAMLVALLRATGNPVPRGELIDWIWEDPPDSANEELNSLASRLRKVLEPLGFRDRLDGRHGEYRLDIPPEYVDVHQFTVLVDRSRQAEDDETERSYLAAAIQLHRGIPLSGLRGTRVDGYRVWLQAEHRAALIRLSHLEVLHGRALTWVPKLTQMFDESPDDALLTETYMSALFRTGRSFDALQVYQRYATCMREGLGLDPHEALTALADRIRRESADLGNGSRSATEDPDPAEPRSGPVDSGVPESGDAPAPSVVNHVGTISADNVVLGVQYRSH